MPTELRLDDHRAAIAAAAEVLLDAAGKAGLDAPVPTCPAWDVRALVTHQGMVHRWAAANLRGDKSHRTADSTGEAAVAPDLLVWFSEGVEVLLGAIREAAHDVNAMVFLKDAPPPRRFWARRQAHETTIHGVDAVAAALGEWPAAADLAIAPELAVDGIDELLCGFITRGKGKLRADEPYTIAVTLDDDAHGWVVTVGEDSVVTRTGRVARADATFSGSAVQLYAGLWNRGDEIVSSGRPDVLEAWRSQVRVRWS